MTDAADPLDRAAELARASHESADGVDWQAVKHSVMRRVAATVRPGRSLVVARDEATGATTHVNERVVVTAVRRALDALPDVAPSDVRLEVEDERCTAVAVAVVVRYGGAVDVQARTCVERVHLALRDVLLDVEDTIAVEVEVVDVSLEDPKL